MFKFKKDFLVKATAISVVLALAPSITGCDQNGGETSSGIDNRQTIVTKATETTVDPDVSEANQSIATDVIISESTTETNQDGYTYTVNGADFTISVNLADYEYNLGDPNRVHFDLDAFMAHWGFEIDPEVAGKYKKWHNNYYDGGFHIMVPIGSSIGTNEYGDNICQSIYLSNEGVNGRCIGEIYKYSLGETEKIVYEVNSNADNNKIYSEYCLCDDQLVILAYILDARAQSGSTGAACERLEEVFDTGGAASGDIIRI